MFRIQRNFAVIDEGLYLIIGHDSIDFRLIDHKEGIGEK